MFAMDYADADLLHDLTSELNDNLSETADKSWSPSNKSLSSSSSSSTDPFLSIINTPILSTRPSRKKTVVEKKKTRLANQLKSCLALKKGQRMNSVPAKVTQ